MKRHIISQNVRVFKWISFSALVFIISTLALSSSCSEPDRSSINEDCNDLCLALEHCSQDEYSGDPDMRSRFYDEKNGFGSVSECSEDCKQRADKRKRECMIDCLEYVRKQETDDDVTDDDIADDDVADDDIVDDDISDDDVSDDDTYWDDFYEEDDIEDEFNFSQETCGRFLECIKDCLGLQ